MNNLSPSPSGLPHDSWSRDDSLRRAAELIEQSAGAVRAVSFDFFDTLVWRLVAKPVDAFHEVGVRLRQGGVLRPAVSIPDFETLRRIAELKLRDRLKHKTTPREDVAIGEIYQQMGAVVSDPVAAAALEHAVEQDLCLLNPIMAGFVEYVRQRGLRLLVISDIYFSAEQLRGILRANHFDPAVFEVILASSEVGVCKGTGNLFRHALKILGLAPSQLLHVGDSLLGDVGGSRKAGVRAVHYQQTTPESLTALDREQFLAGGQTAPFSFESARLLAARQFPGESAEAFFSRAGAFLLGPQLARYATWACEQFVAAGVRKVGAFMREGEMLGSLLQHENAAMSHGLEIMPLYVNRKSTDLAAIGKLSAENLVAWLERRQTLPIKTILEHFGLDAADVRKSPFAPDEKADSQERVLKLAKYLFTPGIAGRIEAQSALERRKIIDYLRPWLETGAPVGLSDLGYNASAQAQLKRILDLEGHPARLVGCYLVTCERTALRVLDGLDVRHFLGAFGRPNFNYYAFLRSPAFVEQCLTAPIGTTLGYERMSDGTVKPVLDDMRFPPELLRCQRGFKDGILLFQKFWLGSRRAKPELLGGASENSRRVLAELDRSCSTILARAAAFPLPDELAHFGALPLDDYYFAEGIKTICGPRERELMRSGGYPKLLTEQGVLWPQGAFHLENPQIAADFFSCGKAMMLCNSTGTAPGVRMDLTIIVPTQPDLTILRDCLTRLKPVAARYPRCGLLLLAGVEDRETMRIAHEFRREFKWFQAFERLPQQTVIEQLNFALDESTSPLVVFMDGTSPLAPDWDTAMLRTIEAAPEVALVFPSSPPTPSKNAGLLLDEFINATPRTFLVRRLAFTEGLGFHEKLGVPAGILNLSLHLRSLKWKTAYCPDAALVPSTGAANMARLPGTESEFLKRQWPDLAAQIQALISEYAPAVDSGRPPVLAVDWIGSFLDHGSLSHVNRELTGALKSLPGLDLRRVANGAAVSSDWEKLAADLATTASSDAAVTVRHAWPPDWKRPRNGKLAVIQPWEFGMLPEQWVKDASKVDEFWVPSEYVRQVYMASGVPSSKVIVVPNGVDLQKFHPQASPRKLTTAKKFKFLFVGGTIFRKGPDLLLEAYLDRFTAADDVCLVIKDFGGQSVYTGQTFEGKIRAAQTRSGAPEILYLNEELPANELPGLYTACDCLVLPYRGEGFGLPVLEAMACGLPVIVTAGGATDDFVRAEFAWRIPAERRIFGNDVSGLKLSGPGWLLEPDIAVLGRFMAEAFGDPAAARRRGQLAAAHARAFYSWQHVAEKVARRVGDLARQGNVNAAPAPARVAGAKMTLPPCALVGHLAEARELLRQKKARAAWEATLVALAKRPFHPEAILLLAEIAQTVGAGQTAKVCAEHARAIAPGWKPARKFLNQRLVGASRPEWLKLPAAFSAPSTPPPLSLTVCLIVKNEEKFLGQCLKSIAGFASQIVVVDTGSTDRTCEIAREYAAEVHPFAWCNDFSAARNAALEHATGDWVLVLDADEEVSAQAREKLPAALANPAVMAWRLPLVDVGREANGFTYVPRLFRNAPGLFYVGRIHEQVFSSVEVRRAEWGLDNRVGDAPLVHHGYTDELIRDRNKVQRNLLLLEQAILEMPGEPHLLMHLGLELARSGRAAEALERDRAAFEILSAKPAREIVPELRETLLLQFCMHLTGAKRFGEIADVLASPLAAMDGGLSASLHFSLGLAYLELRRFREAADQMRQCLAKRLQPSLASVNKEINSAAPHHCLALCLAHTGDPAGAETAFQNGLGEPIQGDGLRMDYARFLSGQNRPVEALQQLHEVVRRNPRNVEGWRVGGQIALGRAEFLKFARDWTAEATRHWPDDSTLLAHRAEVLLLSGNTAEALGFWERTWNQSAQPSALAALILCELLEASTTHAPADEATEAAAAEAYIKWYRRLLAVKANQTVVRLNAQTDRLAQTLPGAARILHSALSEAGKVMAAEAEKERITVENRAFLV